MINVVSYLPVIESVAGADSGSPLLLPDAPICDHEPSGDGQAVRMDKLCHKWEDRLRDYIAADPVSVSDERRKPSLESIRDNLFGVNNSLCEGNVEGAAGYARMASNAFQTLYSADIADAELNIDVLTDFNEGVIIFRNLSLVALAALATAGAAGYLAYGAAFLSAPVGSAAAVSGTGIASLAVAANGAAGAASEASSAALARHAARLALDAYGIMSILNVLLHAGDEPGAEIARLQGETYLGKASRPLLGTVGIAGITDILGARLFGLSPSTCLAFIAGHVISEFAVQHNSSGVSFDNMDWTRVQGGSISALLTFGPMAWLWSGIGVWPGWQNLYPAIGTFGGLTIPSVKSMAGFIISSGLINSALFVPIALYLERANLWNFWLGLTAREYTFSVLRKVLLSIVNPNSPLGAAANVGLKIAENYGISVYISPFAGTGLYREAMHEFLSGEHSAGEFARHCMATIASCNPLFCRTHRLEEDDFELIAADIVAGEFSGKEIAKIAAHVDDILTNSSNRDSLNAGLGWLIIFRTLENRFYHVGIQGVLERHRTRIDSIDSNLTLAEQIDMIE